MLPASFRGNPLLEILFAAAIIFGTAVASRLVVFIFDRAVKAFTRRTRTNLDDLVVGALKRPITLLVIVVGAHAALTAMTILDSFQRTINITAAVIDVFVIAYGAQRVVSAVSLWCTTTVTVRTDSAMDDRLAPIVQRVVNIVIFIVAVLIALQQMNVNISPLLASLGIGGLAVALALQPTLASATTSSSTPAWAGSWRTSAGAPQRSARSRTTRSSSRTSNSLTAC